MSPLDRPRQLDALANLLQRVLLSEKAALETRSRQAVESSGRIGQAGNGDVATAAEVRTWMEDNPAPQRIARGLALQHQMIYVVASRMIALLGDIGKKCPDVVRGWERSGILVDDYNVPEEHRRVAQTLSAVELARLNMSEADRALFDSCAPLLLTDGFPGVELVPENGKVRCRIRGTAVQTAA